MLEKLNTKQLIQYFEAENEEASLDLLVDELFQIKQFFLSKPVLLPTFQAKIKLLEKWATCELSRVVPVLDLVDYSEKQTVLGNWKSYQNFQSKWKLLIMQAEFPSELIELAKMALENERQFAELFTDLDFIDEMPVFGQKIDEMQFNNFLMEAENQGICLKEDLIKSAKILAPAFQLALKRLSLLPKYLH